MNIDDLTLDVSQEVEIKAAQGDVFRTMLDRLAENFAPPPDGKSLQLVLEQWPGGRWFRDLGNGQGHLWGFVQVIKPPTLLEITGPMMMSYPVAAHLQVRLTQIAGGTLLALRHRALGMIDDNHRQGVTTGWKKIVDHIKAGAESGGKK
jgi:Activator of Hsp90 ATPase homolog 1-like protein